MVSVRAAAIACALIAACADPDFEAPDAPPHDDERDGAAHAALAELPFRCPTGDPVIASGPRRERERERDRDDREVPNATCAVTATRPPDLRLSCDAIGCHGGFDYTRDPLTTARHLRGSNGPSCYTCHEEEWRDDR